MKLFPFFISVFLANGKQKKHPIKSDAFIFCFNFY
jgi:hypothetical protein